MIFSSLCATSFPTCPLLPLPVNHHAFLCMLFAFCQNHGMSCAFPVRNASCFSSPLSPSRLPCQFSCVFSKETQHFFLPTATETLKNGKGIGKGLEGNWDGKKEPEKTRDIPLPWANGSRKVRDLTLRQKKKHR